jgi:Ca2+-binding EF-hand superfamily protein
LGLLALSAVGNAMAQGTPVSAKSTNQELSAAFTAADKDRDKSLSPFEARHLPIVSEDFARYDTDGNKFLSLEEFMAALKGAKRPTKTSAK